MRKTFLRFLGSTMAASLLVGTMGQFSAYAAVENGWEEVDGKRYWYENGVKQGTEGRGKEIYDPDSDAWYWLDAVEDGKMAVSKDVYQESLADSAGNMGKWVRYDSDGHMVKGWDITDAGTYYFDYIYGTMAKGSRKIDGVQYFFNEETGIMESCAAGMGNGWVTIEGKEYWYEGGVRQGYKPNAPAYRGKEIYDPGSDAWYWLDNVQQGAKAVSKDVYQESQAGPWAENNDGTGKWVRYDSDGYMVKGWDTNENGTYYFDFTFGTMAKGKVEIEGKEYIFDQVTGILVQEAEPTDTPTEEPTLEPTGAPTTEPTEAPTMEPTEAPTVEPTGAPTTEPTGAPTTEPTVAPTAKPTVAPTTEPTGAPTTEPTEAPTTEPTEAPTTEPTEAPTAEPTGAPTMEPTEAPTSEPTGTPTTEPTEAPTTEPTVAPTTKPTSAPTTEPTAEPTVLPTDTMKWDITDGKLTVTGRIVGEDIRGEKAPWYGRREEITSVVMRGTGVGSYDSLFASDHKDEDTIFYPNVETMDLSGLDTSAVTSMKDMFYAFETLASLNLSGIDTSNVTNMHGMFAFCVSLGSLDLSSFDTSAVTEMGSMFFSCVGLESLDLSGFDTSAVTDMSCMFEYCENLKSLDLGSFDTSAVTDMRWMFRDCGSLESLDLSSFDTSAVTNMGYMFFGCANLTEILVDGNKWNIGSNTNTDNMFYDCGVSEVTKR